MKLLNKYNRINLLITVTIMLVTGLIYYYTISNILTNQIDKDLVLEESEVFSYAKQNHALPDVYESNHQQIIFKRLGGQKAVRRFFDTTYREADDHELEAGRALISQVRVLGQNYQILVIQSKVETEYLIKIIFLITIGVIVILLVILTILNRLVLNRIWQPFYKMLFQLRDFSLAGRTSMDSTPSEIDEFKELNKAVMAMAGRVSNDYQNLKAFTENASHELMTPISVINSKLDTLLQTDEFTGNQSKLLDDIYHTVARLTRLNKSMLLLTKIENGLIQDEEAINVNELLEECLYQHQEMIDRLNINLQTNIKQKSIRVNRFLVEILLNNLIGNAIKHNNINGHISVALNALQLSISNSGKNLFDINQALIRFQKSNESEGTGLGLTLCKQICDNYKFKFQYFYLNNSHTFSVDF